MEISSRVKLIQDLEKVRDSRLIVYITSDRNPHFGSRIATDVLPLFYDVLQVIGKTPKISLFLYSLGGSVDAPWPLVNLIREYCSEFEVIVPFKAHSAATLIALGANNIVMTPLSQLSPVDPTGTFILEGKTQEVSVEDVQSYIELAKQKIGIAESKPLSEVLRLLTQEVSPQILGRINRTRALIRRLAKLLLQLHLTEPKCETQIAEISNNLTEQLFSHTHMINRREARDVIGFRDIVEFANSDLEKLIDTLFRSYKEPYDLTRPLDPANYTAAELIKQACIESSDTCFVFSTPIAVQQNADLSGFSINVNGLPQWRREENTEGH